MKPSNARTTSAVPVGSPEYGEVQEWLYREAALLDRCQFAQWFELLAPDIQYIVPNRLDLQPSEGAGFDPSMALFVENLASLEVRVQRLSTEQAWAEQPRSRTRHLVSNLLVDRSGDGELLANSAFIVTRQRSHRPLDVIAGERQDILRRVDGVLKLAKRTVLLDHTVLDCHNLSVFF
jgi:3-phenylpropionate/cinnamic acid dioxygenase small subunit